MRSPKWVVRLVSLATMLGLLMPTVPAQASSHFETPISFADPAADITDFYAFVSPEDPTKAVLIMSTHGMQLPSGGPYYGQFDPNVSYVFYVDNDQDAKEDLTFTVKFTTEGVRIPGIPLGYIGVGEGVNAPGNSPPPVAPGTPLIPPAITALDGLGSEGLSVRQTYTVSLKRDKGLTRELSKDKKLIAVPSNVGTRTMPDYEDLVQQGIFDLGNGIRAFAGVTDDGFALDLGGIFDSLALKSGGVLSDEADADDVTNTVADSLAPFNVNTIALEVPIKLLTSNGQDETAGLTAADPEAGLGFWVTTMRPRVQVQKDDRPIARGRLIQVARLANPLVNEVLIPTEEKVRWARSEPKDDEDFASFLLDPILARVVNAAFAGAVEIAPPPRADLLPLVQYQEIAGNAPAPVGVSTGPVADLLRLNVAVPPVADGDQKRLGMLAGDLAGYPNGRRVSDDVTDIALRVVPGSVLAGDAFNTAPNNRLGDGVNSNAEFNTLHPDLAADSSLNARGYRAIFPYLAPAHPGNG